jgi:DNA modification methylase
MFTSPPYFSTELYNKGGENEQDQSWSRYNEYDKWREGFFFPMLRKVWPVIKDKGFVFVNIMDPVIKGTRYRTCDELVDFMGDELNATFLGQIGMRIKQRPKKMETGLNEFLTKDFIENIWCFSKNNGIITLNNNATLESLMGDDNELFN